MKRSKAAGTNTQRALPERSGWIAQQLQEAQSAPAFLQALFDGHPDMLFVVDAKSRIIAANANSLAGLSYTKSDLEGNSIDMLLPAEVRMRHAEHMRRYFQQPMGRSMGSGISLVVRDSLDNELPVDIELWPFNAGEKQYVLAVCRRLDADLARRQMHIHALVETAQDYAVNLLDEQGRILTWNEGAGRIYGLSSAEALGQDQAILFSAEERASGLPERHLETARTSPQAAQAEGWRRLADGTEIWAEVRTRASRNGEGRVTGFTHVLHDATRYKRIEEELRLANQSLSENAAELEMRVQERTGQLEEAITELKGKQREIETYAETVSQDLREKEVLLREIHHRVKNNLQVVQSLLRMQVRTLTSADAREGVESAIQRVQVIATVHERLYQMPDISRLPLSAYLKDVVDGAVRSGSAQGAEIDVAIDADDSPISIDVAVPLGLLVNELVLNSLKHGIQGGRRGRIVVSARHEGASMRMAIEDNGPGLPAEFDPEKCTSMGLKLASSLARRLGGELRFTSNPGCRVEVELTRM